MDVAQELANYAAANSTATLDRATPIISDAGLLAAFDNSPVDSDEYKMNLNQHLLALTLTSTQSLISSLFALPTKSTSSGILTILPTPTTILPREKPLPKPKPLTKWERFAKEKGISHKRKEKDVWDEELQDWVPRWGKGGKNRQGEEQWLHEVKAGDDADLDPAKTAKAERKARIAKNEKQHAANIAAAANSAASASLSTSASSSKGKGELSQEEKKNLRERRKDELKRSMLISKTATASLGKYDGKIEGEPKAKGVKRKFEPTSTKDFKGEKESQLDVLNRLEKGVGKVKKSKKGSAGAEGELNVRKAVRFQGKVDRANGKSGGGGAASKKGKR
ncbi:uncharacterized protein I303_100033 [Kwoniella dejecticola CBS 10117]|uniref:Ribosome biogenesis regulatory protein n=1 Tax=Kwoniella dejecticola CBS 10117 TaxID=1296121 RepID=A0A1A6ADS6_9TREE|nr:uncharacterized protein I303_00033 [Kwoniella dejecticola CBS 10117]OBR88222.1 hypothetical protein I303_00033 [Kwoniella dejecticola CBS 10117]